MMILNHPSDGVKPMILVVTAEDQLQDNYTSQLTISLMLNYLSNQMMKQGIYVVC